eukprot:346276-Pyramimonas_sp.AAC.1
MVQERVRGWCRMCRASALGGAPLLQPASPGGAWRAHVSAQEGRMVVRCAVSLSPEVVLDLRGSNA